MSIGLSITFLVVILLFLFILAHNLVEKVYKSGHKIYSMLVGFISCLLLIYDSLFVKNTIISTIIQALYLFGGIIFFMSFNLNFKLIIKGKGNSWLAKRIRRLRSLSKNIK